MQPEKLNHLTQAHLQFNEFLRRVLKRHRVTQPHRLMTLLGKLWFDRAEHRPTPLMRLVDQVSPELCVPTTAIGYVERLARQGLVDLRQDDTDPHHPKIVSLTPAGCQLYSDIVIAHMKLLEMNGFRYRPSFTGYCVIWRDLSRIVDAYRTEEVLGYTKSELLDRPAGFYAANGVAAANEIFRNIRGDLDRGDLLISSASVRAKDGRIVPVEAHVSVDGRIADRPRYRVELRVIDPTPAAISLDHLLAAVEKRTDLEQPSTIG